MSQIPSSVDRQLGICDQLCEFNLFSIQGSLESYNIIFLNHFSSSYRKEVYMETARCSTMPIVFSATIRAEHNMKLLHETTMGFPVTKPSMMVDISIKPAAFILKQKMLYHKIEDILYVYKATQYMKNQFTTVIPDMP